MFWCLELNLSKSLCLPFPLVRGCRKQAGSSPSQGKQRSSQTWCLLAGLLPSFKGIGRVVTGSSLGMQTLLSGGPDSVLWKSPRFLPLWTDRKHWSGPLPPFLAPVRCESRKGAEKNQHKPFQKSTRSPRAAVVPWERWHSVGPVATRDMLY